MMGRWLTAQKEGAEAYSIRGRRNRGGEMKMKEKEREEE